MMKRRIIECALSHPEVDPPITTFLIFVPHEPTHNPPNQLFSCAGSKVYLMTKLALERQNVCTLYLHITLENTVKYSKTLWHSSEVHQLIMWAAPHWRYVTIFICTIPRCQVTSVAPPCLGGSLPLMCIISTWHYLLPRVPHRCRVRPMPPPRTSPRPNQPYPSSIALSSNFSSLPPHHQPSPYPKSLRERFKGKLEE